MENRRSPCIESIHGERLIPARKTGARRVSSQYTASAGCPLSTTSGRRASNHDTPSSISCMDAWCLQCTRVRHGTPQSPVWKTMYFACATEFIWQFCVLLGCRCFFKGLGLQLWHSNAFHPAPPVGHCIGILITSEFSLHRNSYYIPLHPNIVQQRWKALLS